MDRLDAELGKQMQIIRLNIQDAAGRDFARRYAISITPSFVMFDAHGDEAWRSVGALDPAHVRAALLP
ncbi:MAG: thioredoxin family protein [Chloroflexi bacterium]|nr:thioredoxin family protein [Chloroflexota bacterium]